MVTQQHIADRERQRREVINLRKQKVGYDQIALLSGLKKGYILRILKESGDPELVSQINNRQREPSRNARIIGDRANGMKRDVIAKKHNVSPSTVTYVVNKYGPASVRRVRASNMVPISKDERDCMYNDRRGRMAKTRIAKKHKRSYHVVKRILGAANAPEDVRNVDLRRSRYTENRPEILMLFADGFSVTKLAGIYDMYPREISNIVDSVPGSKDSNGVLRIRSMKQLENTNRRLWTLREVEQELLDLRQAKEGFEKKLM